MKKILVLLLCFNIVLAPTYAFANTSLGGWTITQQIAQGASTVLNASKTAIINGASVVKTSTAKITPKASQVAKVLRGGAAGYALSVAVEQLLGAVDWVLDPANNQIKYNTPSDDPTNPSNPKQYSPASWGAGVWHGTPSAACNASLAALKKGTTMYNSATVTTVGTSCHFNINGNTTDHKYPLQIRPNPAYDPNAQQQQKTLSLDVVAQKVIDNAESSTNNDHKVGAQVATTTAAQDMLANDAATQADVETQLNANAKTQTSEEAAAESTPKDPSAPDAGTNIKITFPVFCSWAPTVCEAAQVVISFPQTLTGWWESANQKADEWETSISQAYHDFMRDDELPNDDTKVDITDFPTPELQENAISWGASCPADVSIPISMQGVSSTLVFSWSPWCQLLSIIKPAIIASAYIGAAFIVLGLRT